MFNKTIERKGAELTEVFLKSLYLYLNAKNPITKIVIFNIIGLVFLILNYFVSHTMSLCSIIHGQTLILVYFSK